MSRGRKCCVPGCKSNYTTEDAYTPAFQFPRDESRRNLWIRSIKREEEFKPSKTAVVCLHHFDERFVIKEDSVTRTDGSLLVVPRKKLALTADSYPTKFPNCPQYISKVLPVARKSPSKRHDAVLLADEEKFHQWCENDLISSFEDIRSKSLTETEWHSLNFSNYVLFYRIGDAECPKIIVSFKIYIDLSVKVWQAETEVSIKSFAWLLGTDLKCDRWTKFDGLINKLSVYAVKDQSVEDKLSMAANLLELCMSNDDEEMNEKLKFLEEQVRILALKQLRYSPDFIVWCARFFYSFSSAYVMIRNCKVLTLPHPSYLKKLSAALNVSASPSSHIGYLKKKCSLLNQHEKVVNVLLDEVYVTPSIDYKSGHLLGSAENVSDKLQSATTIQTFMIVSPFSDYKDVVALFPVKNLNAEKLYLYTKNVLKILVECGYSPVCLISDNNRINRNMFLLFCYGNLDELYSDPNESDPDVVETQPPSKPVNNKKKPKPELLHSIPNPYCKDQRLFFLFDSPHLLKCVRNNWLNQKTTHQTFYYPNTVEHEKVSQAKFNDLRNLYDSEKHSIVKLAPKLSCKVLHPSSFERQNVLYAVNLFHDSNTVALSLSNSSHGTTMFIDCINKWWKIVNVKHHEKGRNKNDTFCDPITSTDDPNMKFLQQFCEWMKAWGEYKKIKPKLKEGMGIAAKGGFLSNETQFALQFTSEALIELVAYIFDKYTPKYILLGKFQTDNLEGRFGQYRQMNGGNYSLSCRQVFETEHKLKILSLISLHSEKVGNFHLKYFNCDDQLVTEDLEIPEEFYEVFNSFDDIEINISTMSVLVYIAGYVAYKVSSRLTCHLCIDVLVAQRQLECEVPDDNVNQYLTLISRGGLKWPQKFVIDILICIYTIFTKLISHKYEQHFIQHQQQRNLIVMLAQEKFFLLQSAEENVCICTQKSSALIKRCLSVAANIMLNNYTKVLNDKKVYNKKRKLSTLTGN